MQNFKFSSSYFDSVYVCYCFTLKSLFISSNKRVKEIIVSSRNDFCTSFQGDPEHPICPVMLGDARLASTFADQMLGKDYSKGQTFTSGLKGFD